MLPARTFLLTALLVGCAAAASSALAGDLRFEASTGLCGYGMSEKGSWWNDHYETNIDRRGACWQIGLSQTPWKWGRYDLGWRAAYVRFPKLTTNSVMAARDEDQFNHPNGDGCVAETRESCTIRTKGGGRVQGLSVGPIVERRIGRATLGAEVGLFFYHNEFDVQVRPGPGNPGAFQPYQWNHAEGWRRKPYVGVNARYDWLFLAGRAYHQLDAKGECDMCSGATGGTAWQWTVGISVPLD